MSTKKIDRVRSQASSPPEGELGRRRPKLLLVGLALATLTAIALFAILRPAPPAVGSGGAVTHRAAPAVAYVADATCVGCHAQAGERWRGSHHDQAMAHVGPDSVRGDFADAVLRQGKQRWRFHRADGRYYVDAPGENGSSRQYEIKYTFGVDPLQQYLVEFPGGRLQALPVAWDTRRQRWFHLYPDSRAGTGDPMHWTGRYQNWNLMCAECHSTNLRKGYDAAADTYATRWDEINVGCQSCHGPGAAHQAWADAKRDGKPAPSGAEKAYGLVVDFRAGDSRFQVDQCGACHSRRQRLADSDQPGAHFLDNFRPELLRAGLYHPDGQQLDEVYVYGSMLQSRMYQQGVRCTDCHDAHSLKLKAEGNGVCLQCHNPAGNPRFPTLRKADYDTPAHHHHAAGSTGAECKTCHMPEKNYMVVHARPDHSFRIPRPDLSQKLGTPNACNQCHANKSPAWAAEAVARWYGLERRQEPGFAATFAAARAGRREALPGLLSLLRDPAQPAIVRATATEHLPPMQPEARIALSDALNDSDALVRAYAVLALAELPPAERAPLLVPCLRDPIRLVRINAAQALAALPPGTLAGADQTAFDRAYREYLDAQAAMADMPATQLNLAGVHAQRGDDPAAREAYARALRMDPDFGAGRTAYASYLATRGDRAGAEATLRAGLERNPGDAELRYSLALLLAESGQLPAAIRELQYAARRAPDNPRIAYNLGLALMQASRLRDAEAPLAKAAHLDAQEGAYAYALALLLFQQQRPDAALPHAERALALNPDDRAAQQLLLAIRRGRP